MESRSLQIVEQGTGVITNAAEWNKARIDFVRNTFCGGAPEAEASAFIEICKRRGLAPEERQVYLTKRGDGWVIQTGIDGYRLIADRTGQYAGSDEPLFIGATPEGYPEQASVTVYKMVGGQPRPFTGTAFWSEYFPTNDKQNFMWKKMPRTMLAKCAEALALRKAFPADLSAIYTAEEMDQAGPEATIAERPKAAAKPTKQKSPAFADLDDEQYAVEVSAALASQDGPKYRALVDAAGDQYGRWAVLVDASDTAKAVKWVVDRAKENLTDAEMIRLSSLADSVMPQTGIS
jgi:phage recombination protein Bet